MQTIWQDLRYAARRLQHAPSFAITALLTLGCGIGLTAGMLGVVQRALLAPLPYAHPDRLVALDFQFRGEKPSDNQVGTAADFLMRSARSFQSFGVADGGNTGVNLSDPAASGHAFPVQQLRISHGFLPTLGIQPQLGRLFTEEEDTHNGPRAAILSDSMWRNRFAADPKILGRIVRIDEEDVPVVGVLPAGAVADLQGGTRGAEAAGVFQPLQLSEHDPGYEGTNYQMIARLRDGVSVEQAQQELNTLLPRFAQQNTWYARWHAPNGELNQLRVFPLQTALAGELRGGLLAMLGSAAAVLLVACLNLAGLMVARTAARTRELAVRSALGAGRRELVRLLLAEAGVLAIAGALLGVVCANVVSRAFLAYAPVDLPHWSGASPVWMLAAYTAALAVGATLIFGLLPIAVVLRREVNQSLRSSGSQGQSTAYQRLSRGLIVAQVSLAFVLLTAASLLLHVFLQMRSTAPGVDTAEITIGQVTLKGSAYASTERNVQLEQRVVEQLEHTPGVERAGAVNGLPLDHGLNMSAWPVDRKDLRRVVEARLVSPGYMTAIGIPVLQGRGILEGDRAGTPKVAVISAAAAARWWPKGDAIGQRINFGDEAEYEVVGIARDTHETSLLDAPRILLYIPLTQLSDKFTGIINNWFPTTFVVRASAGVDVPAAMRSAVSAADPELPLSRVDTMQAVVDETVATPRFFGWLSSTFAALTLLLASIGLFGLLSYQVTQRTREIGVRMALGATRGSVLGAFVQRGVLLTVAGLILGALGSLAVPRLLSAALNEFAAVHASNHALATEAQSGLAAALLLLVVTAGASFLPARRASAVEPVTALRAD